MRTHVLRCLSLPIAAACGLLSFASVANAEIVTRVAILSGLQEVPANATTGGGCARIVFDTDSNTATYEIVYWNLSAAETAAHIHGFAGPGVNAGVQILLPSGSTKRGSFNYLEVNESAYLNGQTYVNIHTAAFPGGELRGQIVALACTLDGAQEAPAVVTPARGFGLFNINPATNTLSYYISYGGLPTAETAAHIHGFALPTVATGVQHVLPAGSPKIGSWVYPAASQQNIIDGLTYVNIHSAANGGGEIRGQIVSWVIPMNALQEVPANAAPSAGGALVAIDRANSRLGYDVAFGALTSAQTAAHIHGFAPAGANTGVQIPIANGARSMGTWTFGAANFANVFGERTYFNIHTANFGGGEIRGQIFRGMPLPCTAEILAEPGDVTVTEPTPVSLTVNAQTRNGGGALAYQWRRNGVDLPNAGPFSNVTTAVLTINPTAPILSGDYSCVITNGCGTTTSRNALVTINGAGCIVTCDFNQDGGGDTTDIIELADAIASGTDPYPASCMDFNQDGGADTSDVIDMADAIASGTCP